MVLVLKMLLRIAVKKINTVQPLPKQSFCCFWLKKIVLLYKRWSGWPVKMKRHSKFEIFHQKICVTNKIMNQDFVEHGFQVYHCYFYFHLLYVFPNLLFSRQRLFLASKSDCVTEWKETWNFRGSKYVFGVGTVDKQFGLLLGAKCSKKWSVFQAQGKSWRNVEWRL